MSKSKSKSQQGQKQGQSSGGQRLLAQEPPPTLLEWTVRGISAAVLLALFLYMVWAALQPAAEAEILVDINRGQIEPRGSSWVVPVDIVNQSGNAVSDVVFSVALVDDDGEVVEEESATIGLLGQRESAAAELWFDANPNDYTLRADVGSYKFP